MPSPTADDPLRCPGSESLDGWTRRRTDYSLTDEHWDVCPKCLRALKRTAGAHRVRSKTTASLDKTRDVLAGITREEITQGERFSRELIASRSPA